MTHYENQTERQAIVLKHYPLVRAIAGRIHRRLPKATEIDDLISAGTTGLLEAVDRYESRHSVPFETYARYRIQGAVVDALRADDWVPRSVRKKADLLLQTQTRLREILGRDPTRAEVATRLEVSEKKLKAMVKDSELRPLLSLDIPLGEEGDSLLIDQVANQQEDMLSQWEGRQTQQLVVTAVDALPEREKVAISLHYFHELCLKDVGQVLGVSESRACQLCGQGIQRLKRRLASHLY